LSKFAIKAGLKRGGALTHMDVIFICFHGQDGQAVVLATFRDEPFGFYLYLTSQHTAAVLWDPDEVISD